MEYGVYVLSWTGLRVGIRVMVDIFCSAVASGGMQAALFPPSLWRAEGDQRNKLSVRQRGKGRHINGLRGREGDIVVRKRGVPIIKDSGWRCAPRRTHGDAPDQLRSVTEPRWEKRDSLRCSCCCCCLFCPVPSWMSRDTESSAGLSQSSDGYWARIRKTGSFAKMQGLSSRAHAFSVEALVGKPCKRMKVSEGQESSSTGDTSGDTSVFTGEKEGNWSWIF